MARGFESKDVEFQQAEASKPKERRSALTAEARDAQDRCRTIELALASTRTQLAGARNTEHRRMLEEAIHALEEQLDGYRRSTH